MTESTNFVEKIAASSRTMKGNTDSNITMKISSTVYRCLISMVRKRVGFSTISAAERREHCYPRRDEETRVTDVQLVRYRIDCKRMRAVVQ